MKSVWACVYILVMRIFDELENFHANIVGETRFDLKNKNCQR